MKGYSIFLGLRSVFCVFPGRRSMPVQPALAETDVESTIRELVVKLYSLAPDQVTLKASLAEELGLDEIDQVELIMEIEKLYNMEIRDEVIERSKTFGELVDLHLKRCRDSE